MGGNPLTKQVAELALKKLDARDQTQKGDPHPTYAIFHEGRLIARTGLRHSSNRDIPVPHVKHDLRVNAQFVLGLAHCTKYKEDWLREIGVAPR